MRKGLVSEEQILGVSIIGRSEHAFSMLGSFHGPFSALRHPPCSGQVQEPPRNSGNSLNIFYKWKVRSEPIIYKSKFSRKVH
jgi:hypothetical protein